MSADDSVADVGDKTPRDRPIAPGDLPGRPEGSDRPALAEDLRARTAELDAIAWNLPDGRRRRPATSRDERTVAED